MLEVSQRGAAGRPQGVDAMLSALLFGGLALFLPSLCAWLPQGSRAWLLPAWQQLRLDDLDSLALLLTRSLRPLLVALLLLLGLCGVGWLCTWRLRVAQTAALASEADSPLPSLMNAGLWLVGTIALLPQWLELTLWPTESYAATLLSCARGLLWLCTMAAVLRVVLSLRR